MDDFKDACGSAELTGDLKMKELVSTAAVSARHARAKKKFATGFFWIGFHTLIPLHTCNMQRPVTCVEFGFTFQFMELNSCMSFGVFFPFCFPGCIWFDEAKFEIYIISI